MVVLASETPGSAKPRTSQHALNKAVELEANGETIRATRFLTLALKREAEERVEADPNVF
jgi:hypothetical protein